MSRLSIWWVVAAAFLVVGGFVIAVLPFGLAWIDSEHGIDALCFLGPLGGGLLAALASRRGRIGEIGLGALLALGISTAASLLLLRSVAFGLIDGGTLTRLIRSAALFCVGSMAGAGIGHTLGKRLSRRAQMAPILWFMVGGTAALGAMFLVSSVAVQVTTSPAILGLIVIIGAPSLGAMVAQLMVPVRRSFEISVGSAALPTVVILISEGGIGGAIFAFLMMWLTGSIGVRLAMRIRPPAPAITVAEVPAARVED